MNMEKSFDSLKNLFIFPLRLVLVPGELVPLNIFEVRYIDLMKTCLSKNIPFGICQLLDGREIESSVTYERVGCSASITNWEMPKMGLYHIEVEGKRPFKILRTKKLKNKLVEAEINWLDDQEGTTNQDHVAICNSLLREIFAKLNEPHSTLSGEKNTPRWLSYRLTEFLASDLKLKQKLLEERNDALRIKQIVDLLGLNVR